MMITGRVHSTESFGSVDGPGVRFVIFLQGCRLRCRYCHNPDTWDTQGGEEFTARQLLDSAERYRGYWGREGGITVSGGEPLLQIDFLLDLFRNARLRGMNTCVDTAGQPFSLEGASVVRWCRSWWAASPSSCPRPMVPAHGISR